MGSKRIRKSFEMSSDGQLHITYGDGVVLDVKIGDEFINERIGTSIVIKDIVSEGVPNGCLREHFHITVDYKTPTDYMGEDFVEETKILSDNEFAMLIYDMTPMLKSKMNKSADKLVSVIRDVLSDYTRTEYTLDFDGDFVTVEFDSELPTGIKNDITDALSDMGCWCDFGDTQMEVGIEDLNTFMERTIFKSKTRRKTMKIDTRIGKGRTRKSAIRKDEEYGILHGRKYNLDGKTFTLDYNERGDEYSLYLDEGKDFPTFIGTVVGDANESDIQDWIDVEYGKYRSKKKTDLYEGQKVEVDGKTYSLYWIEEGRNAPRDKYSVMDDETGESLECEVSDTMTMDEIKDEIRYCVGVNARMGKSKSQLNKSKGIRLKGYNGTWKVIKSRGQFSLLESEQMGKKALNIVLKGKKILKEVDADKDKATKEFFGNNDAEKCNSKTFKADDVEEDVEEDEKQTSKSKIGKRMMMKSFARNFIKSIKLKGSRFVKTAEGVKRHFMLAWDSDSYLANFEFIDEEESPSYEDVRDAVNAYVEEFINSIYEDLSNDSDMTNEVCYEAVGELEQVKWSIVNELTDAYCDYAGITKSKSKIGKRKFSKEESPKSDFKEMEHPETDEKINGKNAVSDEDGKPDIIPEDDEMPSETALPDEMLNHEELEEINSTEDSAQASILDLDPSDAIDKMRNHGMTLSDLRDSLRKQDLGSRSAQVNPSGYPYAKIGEGKLSNVLHRPTGEVRKF